MMWIKDIEVIAGGKVFKNLGEDRIEIDFDIPFSNKEEPDISEVNLYNLSDSTIASIKSEGFIYVNAGYQNLGNKGNVLTGKIEELETTWEGQDKITKILVSDGGKEWRNTTINKTYAADTKASYIMRELANLMGYEVADIEPKEDIEYKLGKTINGRVEAELRQLVKDTKSKMFINKNRIYIREEEKGTETGFILNFSSGLIGSPERMTEEEDGKEIVKYKVTMLLNPLVFTDSLIQVESRTLNGRFRILEGIHTKEFNTEVIIKEG